MKMKKNLAGIISKCKGDIGKALVRTFFARGVVSVGSFLLIVTLGRLYGAAGVGVFALAQSLISAVGIISRSGMNGAILRFVGRDLKSPKVYGYLKYACIKAGIISTLGLVVIVCLRHVFAKLFHSEDLASLLVVISVAVPPFVLAFILSGFMAAARKPATACMLQNGAISFVTAGLVVALHVLIPEQGVINVGIAYATGAWVVCLWGGWSAWKWLQCGYELKRTISRSDVREFKRSSSAFLATDIATFLIAVVGIWVAGYWLPTASVGLYKAASQLAMLIGVILSVINLIVPTRFSHLFYNGSLAALEVLAKRSVYLGLGLAAIPLFFCLVAPGLVLQMVGREFTGAANVLRILAIGQLLSIGCGSVGHLLNMTGNEVLSRNIAWSSNIVGLAMIAVATPLAGIVGVAIGVAMAMGFRKLLGVYFVWRRLGIWMIPVPNILRMIGVSTLTA